MILRHPSRYEGGREEDGADTLALALALALALVVDEALAPCPVADASASGAGTDVPAFFARRFAGLVGLLDFAGALVVRFFAGGLLFRFFAGALLGPLFRGALLVRFFVAFFAGRVFFVGVRLVAMAPPGTRTLSETLPRARSSGRPSYRRRRQTRIAPAVQGV